MLIDLKTRPILPENNSDNESMPSESDFSAFKLVSGETGACTAGCTPSNCSYVSAGSRPSLNDEILDY